MGISYTIVSSLSSVTSAGYYEFNGKRFVIEVEFGNAYMFVPSSGMMGFSMPRKEVRVPVAEFAKGLEQLLKEN